MKSNPLHKELGPLLARWTERPDLFVKDVFGADPEPYQLEMLNTLRPGREYDRVAMKSAHGVGKSTGHAFMGWCFLVTRPYARIVATAPTKAQLTDALWPEYAKWFGVMQERQPKLAAYFDVSETHIRMRAAPKSWFAVARTSNRPENLQGFHGKHILIQVDEGSAVPQNVFEVIEGALSNADFEEDEVLLVLTGNPNFTAGEFFDAFTKNKGLYHRISVTGDPDTKFDPKIDGLGFVSRRVTEKYRSRMEAKYGLNSAVYDVRVRGVFPREDDKAVIPLSWAERARHVPLPIFDQHAHPVRIVMDVARRGGDKTTCGVFRLGHLIKLRKWPITSGPQCEDILVEEYKFWRDQNVPVEAVIVDEPGVGGPILDGVKRRGVPATGYHGGRGLSEANGDDEDDRRMFANVRARDWWRARRIFERRAFAIALDDLELAEELVAELASVHYDYNGQEKIQVESKKDMKARLGDGASPDLADTVIMGLSNLNSTAAALGSMMPEDLDELGGTDRPTAEAQLDMESMW